MPRSDLPPPSGTTSALSCTCCTKLGGWPSVQRALPVSDNTLWLAVSGRAEVSATLAFCVAKFIDAPISAVLTGDRFLPGTCRHCGRSNE